MANYVVSDSGLTSIADAIRLKGDTSATLEYPAGFVSAVQALPQMTDTMRWLGADVELFKTFDPVTIKLADTGFHTWTPSSSPSDILGPSTIGTFTTTDFGEYEYYIAWECSLPIVYTGSPENKAKPLFCVSAPVQAIFKRPSSWAKIQSDTWDGNCCENLISGTFMRYYGSTANVLNYAWHTSYGFYFSPIGAVFSWDTAENPVVTVRNPKVTARCLNDTMSTANAALIDQDNTKITMKAKVYKAKAPSVWHGDSAKIVQMINGG